MMKNIQCPTESTVQKQKVEDKVVREDAQEAASIPDKNFNVEHKVAFTQTDIDFNDKFDDSTTIRSEKNESFKGILENRGIPKIWSGPDDPVPQWLISEALQKEDQNNENKRSANANIFCHDDENNIATNHNHENIIINLEKQLCATKADLEKALNEQFNIKNKYKKALKDVKFAADEERDNLQRKLVQICTSIIDKFGSESFTNNTLKSRPKKNKRKFKYFGKFSRKIRRKLRIESLKCSKLKDEILMTKKYLNEKTQEYDSIVKSFSSLKMELKNTKLNLNDMMNENKSLRIKIADAREWMQIRDNKEFHEKVNSAKFHEIQRGRELTLLKKKSEEDFSIIAQLRSKLLRTESANSNKSNLLNNYKNQLAAMTKEKELLSAKIKKLENDNSSLKSGNAQLKTNLTLINRERDKLSTESEKSEVEIRERQSKLAIKYERLVLQKIESMREKCDTTIAEIEIKLAASKNSAEEYRSAINRFLKETCKYHCELNAEHEFSCSEASEREAHETACEILNITPGELTGFLKGHQPNAINSWLIDVEKITAKKFFAVELGKFLHAKAIGNTKI